MCYNHVLGCQTLSCFHGFVALQLEHKGPWMNPEAPVNMNFENYGTERDVANCPFFLKTGACRFGERCFSFFLLLISFLNVHLTLRQFFPYKFDHIYPTCLFFLRVQMFSEACLPHIQPDSHDPWHVYDLWDGAIAARRL